MKYYGSYFSCLSNPYRSNLNFHAITLAQSCKKYTEITIFLDLYLNSCWYYKRKNNFRTKNRNNTAMFHIEQKRLSGKKCDKDVSVSRFVFPKNIAVPEQDEFLKLKKKMSCKLSTRQHWWTLLSNTNLFFQRNFCTAIFRQKHFVTNADTNWVKFSVLEI